jgi:hypothetical protein
VYGATTIRVNDNGGTTPITSTTANYDDGGDATLADRAARTGQCSLCGKQDRFIRQVDIYYQAGNNLRIENFCIDTPPYNYTTNNSQDHNDNCCYHKYFHELGFTLSIAGYEEKAYHFIRGIFISSPIIPTITTKNNKTTVDTRRNRLKGGSISFEAAVHVAYSISSIVRQYLNAVDHKKVPDVLDIERNPRLFAIRYRLLCDPLIIKTRDSPLSFRWSIMS